MTDDTTRDRVNLKLPIGNKLAAATEVKGGPSHTRLVLRGDRDQAETLALHLLAELTGDEALFDNLQFDEIRTALRTLGEIGSHGLDVDLEDELSEPQKDVMTVLAKLHEAGMRDAGMTE